MGCGSHPPSPQAGLGVIGHLSASLLNEGYATSCDLLPALLNS
jgi:hypothetical protein